jgi:hypothetical protein
MAKIKQRVANLHGARGPIGADKVSIREGLQTQAI